MRKALLCITILVALPSPGRADGPISGTSVNLSEALAGASTSALAPAAALGPNSIGFGANTMTLSSDSIPYSGQNYISTLHLDHNFGGPGMTGSRAGLDVSMIMRGTSSNRGNLAQYYVGIADYVQCGFNDNGSAGMVNAAGSCVAINPIADLGSGSFWYTLNAEEVDVIASAGSSSAHTFGTLSVKSGTGPRGSADDAALAFAAGNGEPTWATLIQVGKSDGTPPTASDTKLIACARNSATGAPCPLGAGVDLRDFTINGAAFASAGYSVDGSGRLAAASVATSTITAPGGQVGSIVVDVQNGGYTTPPTVIVAPPPSGIQATAAVTSYGMAQWTMTAGGGGYRVNDVLSLGGGGAPSANLALNISEDAWQGDAQYTVSVDGQQIGGVLTASASHGAGQTQSVPVNAPLSPGAHSLVVTFLNDAYGGSPSTDRNLYVDGIMVNGAPAPNGSATMYGAGPVSFNVVVPPATSVPSAGGSPAKVIVTAVDGNGAITATGGVDGGAMSSPPTGPVPAAGGSGGGAWFNMTAYVKTIGVTSGGSGYTTPPAISINGTTGGGTTAHAVIGGSSNGVLIGAFVRGADPTSSDIPDGQCADWNNTAAGTYKHVCNFGGALRSAALN